MTKRLLAGMISTLIPFTGANALGGYGSYTRSGSSMRSSLPLAALPHTKVAEAEPVSADELTMEAGSPARELVIIDGAVPDKHLFYQQTRPGIETVEIDSNSDGLAQLLSILEQHKNLQAVHIVSHAEDGVVLLGNSRITQSTIRDQIEFADALRQATADGADLRFYGCDLAQSSDGEELLELIAGAADVDIAASNNLTGNAADGGDWDLEVRVGDITTSSPFSETALKSFDDVLAINDGTGKTITTDGFANGYDNTKSYDVDGSGFVLQLSTSSVSAYAIYCDSGLGYCAFNFGGALTDIEQLYVEFTDGSSFDIDSIDTYSPLQNSTYVFTPSSGSPVNGNGFATHNLNFTNITRLTITRQDGTDVSSFNIDNLVIKNVAPIDSDGNLTAAGGVNEPIALDTTIDTVGEAVDIFDFTLTDGGTGDGLAMGVSQVVLNVTGTSTDAQRANITYRLNGNDASNVTGVYNSGDDTITFSSLSISVADNSAEVYTVNAYYNDNTSVTDGATVILSVDGDTDLTVDGAGTQMGSTSAVTNSTGTTTDVVATALAFTTQPATSVSGSALGTQPGVTARDAFGNTDTGFTETITLTEASPGSLTGGTVAASSGVATFTSATYTATTDQQSFTLTANDQDGVGSDLSTVDASAVTSDVVATQLVFDTQPAPLTVNSGEATSFTTVPVVSARDGNGVVDTGYSTGITLAEVSGAGSATLSATGDTDGSGATATITPSSGTSTFTSMQITYTNAGGSNENFNLQASSGGLTTANSSQLTGLVPDTDGSLTAAAGVSEPVNLPLSIDTIGEAVNIFDVTITDGGTADGLPLNVSGVAINVSGTSSDAERSAVTWRLNGPDAVNAMGTYNAGSDTISFAGANVSIADGASEVYTLNAYYNDPTAVSAGSTFVLSVDGDTDLTVGASGTQMGSTSAITNGSGTAAVDDIGPTVTSVAVPANSTYSNTQNLDFTVNFDEDITVVTTGGTPQIALTVGATVRQAAYVSGAGSTALLFRYTVQAGDADSDGIAVGALAANGGTLRDSASNDATLTLNSVGSTVGVLIDALAPTVTEVTPVTTPSNDSTPNVTFNTDEAGTLAVGGSCGSGDEGAVSSGDNTITLTQPDNSTALTGATYSDCTVTVTDAAGNASSALTLTSFTVDLTEPTVAEVTPVSTPGNDTTPDVTISTNEAGTLAVGGSCGSGAEGAIAAGNITITLTQTDNSTPLTAATYSDCTVTVTDEAGNSNTPVTLTSFEVLSTTAPTFAKLFTPDSIAVDGVSTLTFTIDNSGNGIEADDLDFTDNLPTGMSVATPSNAASTCTGGTLTAVDAAAVVALTGASVAASSSCTVSVDVTGSTAGELVNTSGDLTSSLGNSGTASDSLFVNDVPGFSKAFSPNPGLVREAVTLTYTIDNSGNPSEATSLTFSEALPSPLTIAAIPNAASTCHGGTLTAAAGTQSIDYSGGSVSGGSSCTVQVDVVSPVPGTVESASGALTSDFGSSGAAAGSLVINGPPVFTASANPDPISTDESAKLSLTIDNSQSSVDATAMDFAAVIPGPVVLATPVNAASTCTGGTVTALDGGSTFSYSGGAVSAGVSCEVTVDVTSATVTSTTVTTGTLTSSLGVSGSASTRVNVVQGIDLAIEITNGETEVGEGALVDYLVTVSNSSAVDAELAVVSIPQPVGLIDVSWECEPEGVGADCGNSGDGSILDLADIPAGTNVKYLVTGVVDLAVGMDLTVSGEVQVPDGLSDTQPGNNSATDVDPVTGLLFRSGFEEGEIIADAFSESFDVAKSSVLDTAGALPTKIAEVRNEQTGAVELVAHVRRNSGKLQLRTSTRSAEETWDRTDWQPIIGSQLAVDDWRTNQQ